MRNTETYNTLQKPEILFPTMKPLDLREKGIPRAPASVCLSALHARRGDRTGAGPSGR